MVTKLIKVSALSCHVPVVVKCQGLSGLGYADDLYPGDLCNFSWSPISRPCFYRRNVLEVLVLLVEHHHWFGVLVAMSCIAFQGFRVHFNARYIECSAGRGCSTRQSTTLSPAQFELGVRHTTARHVSWRWKVMTLQAPSKYRLASQQDRQLSACLRTPCEGGKSHSVVTCRPSQIANTHPVFVAIFGCPS